MNKHVHCHECGKPIWDVDFITVWDGYMDEELIFHSQCYETETLKKLDAEVEAAEAFFNTDFGL